ncbi:hypothetical protein C8046_14105 [Serinibacter arcticus]|uniref:Lipoprotein n=1 Tax=Serinibacter arcticus TaxID=1655435 RepID=A0A2U1ZXA4_9MICO|nr:hypothetical protein [Serinibacter arcticus]PWD51609.1 hypothetical protein C8046_14105 [Serinibacter arcticus]
MGRTARATATAGLVAAATLALGGCSAVPGGVVGLTVDDAGRVLALLAPCDGETIGGEVDDVVLTRLIPGERGSDAWDRISHETNLDLVSDGAPIEVVVEAELEPGESYYVHALGPSLPWSPGDQLERVDLDTEIVAGLTPGEVVTGLAAPRDLLTREEFDRTACEHPS